LKKSPIDAAGQLIFTFKAVDPADSFSA